MPGHFSKLREDAASALFKRPPEAVPVRSQKRPWLVAIGVLACALGALGTLWLVNSVGERKSVLALARDVSYGSALSAADLTTVAVAGDPGVASVPADRLAEQIGRIARTELLAGTLLAPQATGTQGLPGKGQVLVALPLPADRMPAGGLTAGDRLLAIDARSPSAAPIAATVVRTGAADAAMVTVVDVVTDPAAGPALARAAVSGELALVVTAAE